MTVSPRIRLFALIGVLAALALAGAMFFLSRSQTDAAAAQPLPPPAIVKPKPVIAKHKQVASAKPKAAPKQASKPAKPKPKKKPPVVAANGLPISVATQLAKHGVVVVALYAGDAAVDRMARDEAQAGAGDARVGFAAVDVADKRAIDAMTRKVEVVGAPAVLVLGRGGKARARLDGFADRLMVAQIAASVR